MLVLPVSVASFKCLASFLCLNSDQTIEGWVSVDVPFFAGDDSLFAYPCGRPTHLAKIWGQLIVDSALC